MAAPPTTPLILPTAGVGGSYYDTVFEVPVYPNSINHFVTWRWLDFWNDVNVNYASTRGIAAGLVWATITYLLALTPNRKRTTAFHSFMLAGLVFLLLHLMIDIFSSLTPGLQTLSAYTALTFDVVDSVWTEKIVATSAASQVTGWFALTFALICLWLQAKGLMTGLKARHPLVYRIVLSYLVLASLAALGAAMGHSIYQIIIFNEPPSNLVQSTNPGYTARVAYLASYTICIGSYSLVSMVSVVDIVWKRPSSVMTSNSAYSTALNLIGLLCAQSFVVPFIFCVIQIIPTTSGLLHPEIMLLPSVYAILPLGPLFMSVNSNLTPKPEDSENLSTPTSTPAQCNCKCNDNLPAKLAYTDSEATLNPGPTESPPSPRMLDATYVARELRRIDAMECGDGFGMEHQTNPEIQAMLRDRDSQEKEVVFTMKTAP